MTWLLQNKNAEVTGNLGNLGNFMKSYQLRGPPVTSAYGNSINCNDSPWMKAKRDARVIGNFGNFGNQRKFCKFWSPPLTGNLGNFSNLAFWARKQKETAQ